MKDWRYLGASYGFNGLGYCCFKPKGPIDYRQVIIDGLRHTGNAKLKSVWKISDELRGANLRRMPCSAAAAAIAAASRCEPSPPTTNSTVRFKRRTPDQRQEIK